MFWALSVLFIALAAVAILTSGAPSQPPPADQTIDIPTAEEGRPIPVLFGTKVIKGVNVLWSGDIDLIPIKSKGGKK